MTLGNLENFIGKVRNVANGRCPVDMSILLKADARASAVGVFIHILREASASLLVQLYRAIPEPPSVGRATGKALTLSFYKSALSGAEASFFQTMIPNKILPLGWLAGSMLCCFIHIKAQDEVPCVILSGNSESEQCIDLSKLNRITFSDGHMSLTSSSDSGIPGMTFAYSAFNRIRVASAIPSQTSAVDELKLDSKPQLIFETENKSLRLISSSETPYSITIFSTSGQMVYNSKIQVNQEVSVATLPTGVYVAVTNDGTSNLSLKFIIK